MSDHETRNTAAGDANRSTAVDRREFMKSGAATSVAALVTAQAGAAAAPAEAAQAPAAAAPPPPAVQVGEPARRHASDYMVDIFKSLDMEYMFAMCASSFRGLHESLVNYGGNKDPEVPHLLARGNLGRDGARLLQDREETALIFAHGTVGLQHATMALYNAWCDRVPVYCVVGNTMAVEERVGASSGTTPPRICAHRARLHEVGRLSGIAAALRGVDGSRLQDRDDPADAPGADRRRRHLQENPIEEGAKLRIPKLPGCPPQGDSGAVVRPRACWSMPSIPC